MTNNQMNVMELFAGVGGFRIALEHANSDLFKTTWTSQWEPGKKKQAAFDCYTSQFDSGIHSNEDISKVTDKTFAKQSSDLIVGGFPCFKEGTLITTKEGLKEIQDIQKDDLVLTHTNTFKKVVLPMKQKKKGIYTLKVQGSPITHVTEEHPIYVREKKVRTPRIDGKAVRKVTWSEPMWVDVKDLVKGKHYIAMSQNMENSNPKNITKEEAWLIGRYIADGYILNSKRPDRKNSYRNQVVFCVGKSKLKEFEEKVQTYNLGISEERTVYKCRIINSRFTELCLSTGKGASNKEIPGFIQDLPDDLLEYFLEGYMSGDGCVKPDGYHANSISRKLIYGLGQIVQKLYENPYSVYFFERPKTTIIEGRTVNQKDTWSLAFKKERPKHMYGTYIDNILYMPIKDIDYDDSFHDYVYNFEVEDDNSYVANNMTVHNCQNYSVARTLSNNEGIEGEKGVLFWEIKRAVKATSPKYLLLENVDRLLKSPAKQRGRDFAIMLATFRDLGYIVEWRVINSAEHGSPQRRKRTFIFAYKDDTDFRTQLLGRSFESMIYKYGFFAPIFPVEGKPYKGRVSKGVLPKDIVDISDNFSFDFHAAGVMHKGIIHTEHLMAIPEKEVPMKTILQPEKDVSEEFYLTQDQIDKFTYLRGPKKIERTSKDGYTYTFSEGGMSLTDDINKPSRTMLTSEGSVNRSTHIIEVDGRKRFLTPIECERLNGFPDDWTKGMTKRMRYFCMGNALVIPMVERMAKRLSDIITTT